MVDIHLRRYGAGDQIRFELEALLAQANEPCTVRVEDFLCLSAWMLTIRTSRMHEMALVGTGEQTPRAVAHLVKDFLLSWGLV
jgi:hypothetical protein